MSSFSYICIILVPFFLGVPEIIFFISHYLLFQVIYNGNDYVTMYPTEFNEYQNIIYFSVATDSSAKPYWMTVLRQSLCVSGPSYVRLYLVICSLLVSHNRRLIIFVVYTFPYKTILLLCPIIILTLSCKLWFP